MRIRSAQPADAPALVGLYAAWDHPLDADAIRERIEVWSAAPFAAFLVAELDGAPAGLAGVSASPHLARPGRFARLAGLSVDPAVRRRGVGRALVRAAEELARGWGCDRMEITSSRWRHEAPAFYPALGYEDASGRQARFIRAL
jgi:GNAT superfamily N-acetyltransferase